VYKQSIVLIDGLTTYLATQSSVYSKLSHIIYWIGGQCNG